MLQLPILSSLIHGGVDYGINILVEFEPDSLWYETSFTIAANMLKSRIRVHYHTFVRPPQEVRGLLAGFGLDIDKLQQSGLLKIIDSHTAQVGLSAAEGSQDSPVIAAATQSLKMADWSIGFAKEMKAGTGYLAETEKGLHLDDNTSVLLQYNDEKTFVDVWRTRNLPHTRLGGMVFLYAFVTGVGSSTLYRQLESLSDGIVDFKSPETGGQIEHLMRVRTMRGKTFDSRWRRIRLMENGEVALAD
jgi:KaiC/GvpD/RAD55 family RecA-like ATPase